MSSLILVLATFSGGASLLLFGIFLLIGPLHLVATGWSEPIALAWDAALSLVFFVQHSVMLRSGFRSRLAKLIPPHAHGALYAMVSGIVLTALVVLWQGSSILIYGLQGSPRWLLRGLVPLSMAGFTWAAYALRSFDPLGLAAIRVHGHGQELPPAELIIRGPYLWVRHPLYSLSIVLIWSNPDVTTDRLLFNVLWTTWIYVGTFFEETDLVSEFGAAYRDYQRRVPRLIPWRWPSGS
jgi:protein-S-isoprenylcysteine O-methyltransferase Ste14